TLGQPGENRLFNQLVQFGLFLIVHATQIFVGLLTGGRAGALAHALDDLAGVIGGLRIAGNLLADENFRRRVLHLMGPGDRGAISRLARFEWAHKALAIERIHVTHGHEKSSAESALSFYRPSD